MRNYLYLAPLVRWDFYVQRRWVVYGSAGIEMELLQHRIAGLIDLPLGTDLCIQAGHFGFFHQNFGSGGNRFFPTPAAGSGRLLFFKFLIFLNSTLFCKPIRYRCLSIPQSRMPYQRMPLGHFLTLIDAINRFGFDKFSLRVD